MPYRRQRRALAGAAADVRLVAAELAVVRGAGHLADILLDVAAGLDRLTGAPTAA